MEINYNINIDTTKLILKDDFKDINILKEKSTKSTNKFIKVFMKNIYNNIEYKDDILFIFLYLIRLNKIFYNIIITGNIISEAEYDPGYIILLFDNFINYYNGNLLLINESKKKSEKFLENISKNTHIYNMNSVNFLYKYNLEAHIDLLYLNSNSFEFENITTNAVYHLQELGAIISKLKKGCIVIIENIIPTDSQISKGTYVINFLHKLGKKKILDSSLVIFEI